MNEPREEWQAISTLLRTASDLLAKCEGHYGRSAEVVALEAAIEAFYESGEPKARALTRSRLAEIEQKAAQAILNQQLEFGNRLAEVERISDERRQWIAFCHTYEADGVQFCAGCYGNPEDHASGCSVPRLIAQPEPH